MPRALGRRLCCDMAMPMSPESSPFAVFTFLVAPAIMTNACTLLALGTSNRLARAIDRARVISVVLLAVAAGKQVPDGVITPEIAEQQFEPASWRCRVLIRALRSFYLSIGSFAAGTCIAMLGASLGYFGHAEIATGLMVVMLVMVGVGVISLVGGSVFLVQETMLTLRLLRCESEALRKAAETIRQRAR